MKANLIIASIFLAGTILLSIIKLKEISKNKRKVDDIFVQWFASGLTVFPLSLITVLIFVAYPGWLYYSNKNQAAGFYYALSSLSIIVFLAILLYLSTFCALGSAGLVIRNVYFSKDRISRLEIKKSNFRTTLQIFIRIPDSEKELKQTVLIPKKKLIQIEEYIRSF